MLQVLQHVGQHVATALPRPLAVLLSDWALVLSLHLHPPASEAWHGRGDMATWSTTRSLEAPEAEHRAKWCKRTDTHRPFHRDSRLTKSNTCTVGRWKFGGRLACYQQAPSEEWPIFAYFCNLGVDPTTKHDVQTCLNVSANTTYSSDLSMFRGSGTLLTMAWNCGDLWRNLEACLAVAILSSSRWPGCKWQAMSNSIGGNPSIHSVH